MFKVYCGRDPRQVEAVEVFKFSMTENASIPVEFEDVSAGFGRLKDFKRTGVTSFSFARFAAVWLNAYEGRAVYADAADQLCLGDVAELAEFDLQGKPLAVVKHPSLPNQGALRARSWTSLMVLDCAHPKLRRWTPKHVESAPDSNLMRLADFSDDEIGELPGEWNALCMPGSEPSEGTKLAHYSAISDPNCGPWIQVSGSMIWAEALERWRAAR